MKIQTIAATTLLALFASTAAFAGDDDLTIVNRSGGSIAVGNAEDLNVFGVGSADWVGGRAVAGSVLVKGCGCDNRDDVMITNASGGSIAVGRATSGSVVVTD